MEFPHISEIKSWPFEEQQEFYQRLTPNQLAEFKYHWPSHARPKQILPKEGWNRALVLAGRGFGKALCLKTVVPTENNHSSTIGDIKVGDKVFDENGKKCNVLAVHEVPSPDSCYRLTFSDGETVDCCSEHQWATIPYIDLGLNENWGLKAKILTTQNVVNNLLLGGSEKLHCIPKSDGGFVSINGFKKIKSVPMRCLTVDSPNSLFLCGENKVPTHNTRLGVEWIRQCVEEDGCMRIGLIGPNAADLIDVIWSGDSGLQSVSPPWNMPVYIASRAKIQWPNGAVAKMYSAESPENLRGPQHEVVLFDEPARCKYAKEVYNQAKLGLRLKNKNGLPPRMLLTTTPKPIPLIKNLINESQKENSKVILIRGGTDENKDNLDEDYLEDIYSSLKGTRLGRQELDAELLTDHEGALWSQESIDDCHKGLESYDTLEELLDDMQRVVMGVDPSGSDGTNGDETGIVVAGKHVNGKYYVIADVTVRESPEGWARAVKNASIKYQVDKIIVEKNNGGDMVRSVVHNIWPDAPIKKIHAKRGKSIRAQPVSMLYEQGKVKHFDVFHELEEQMSNMTEVKYEGSNSPDRLDAMVYAILDLRDSNGAASLSGIRLTGRVH